LIVFNTADSIIQGQIFDECIYNWMGIHPMEIKELLLSSQHTVWAEQLELPAPITVIGLQPMAASTPEPRTIPSNPRITSSRGFEAFPTVWQHWTGPVEQVPGEPEGLPLLAAYAGVPLRL
jgi:hypothetical protein